MKVLTSIFLTLLLCGIVPFASISAESSNPADPVMDLINVLGCKGCHQIRGKGSFLATDLTTVGNRLTAAQIEAFLSDETETRTESFMPSYRSLSDNERQRISEYLYNLH